MIVRCAMERKESRGLHYTLDYPELSNEIRKTVLTPPNFKVEQPLVNEWYFHIFWYFQDNL